MDRFTVRSQSVSQSSSLKESGSLSSISSSKITSGKSIYWKYFTKNEVDASTTKANATCKLCNAVVSLGGKGKTANTSNLKHHMAKFHIEKLSEELKEKNVDNAEAHEKQGSSRSSASLSENTTTQPKIFESFENMQLWDINSTKSKKIHYYIGELIAIDIQPFSIVNDVGFKRLLNKMVPCYNIPSDRYFRERIVPDIYEKCSLAICKELSLSLNENIKISVTTDIWTCKHNNNSFISFTAHWIGFTTTKRCSFVLACRYFPGSHTTLNISQMLSDLMTIWKLEQNQVLLVLADNAANMKKGIEEVKLKHQPCFIHTIQLAIHDSIESQRSIVELLAKARRIVTHFSHSSLACDRLKNIQKSLNIAEKSLVQDVSTRWNSSFYMLERLIEQKNTLNIYIINNPALKDVALAYHQWELARNLLNLLKPFEEITKIFSKDSASISEVIPLLKTLLNYLDKAEGTDFSGVQTTKNELKESLNKRCKAYFTDRNLLFATLLDPRFKISFFDNDLSHKTFTELKNEILKINGQDSDLLEDNCEDSEVSDDDAPLAKIAKKSNEVIQDNQETASGSSSDTLFWNTFEELTGMATSKLESSKERTDIINKIDDEIKMYVNLDKISRNEDPLTWWAQKKDIFPLIYKVAIIYLAPPPSSVASEQLFSSAGNVYESARSRLTPERAESLILLHYNLPKLNFQY